MARKLTALPSRGPSTLGPRRLPALPHEHGAVYQSVEWQRARAIALNRAARACEQCGATGRLHVDHVIELRDGGDAFDVRNLRVLCVPCHNRKTRAARQARDRMGGQIFPK